MLDLWKSQLKLASEFSQPENVCIHPKQPSNLSIKSNYHFSATQSFVIDKTKQKHAWNTHTRSHLQCYCSNTHSVRNKQDHLLAFAQFQSYNIIDTSETWEKSCDCCVMMDSCRPFSRSSQEGRWGLALCVREELGCSLFKGILRLAALTLVDNF